MIYRLSLCLCLWALLADRAAAFPELRIPEKHPFLMVDRPTLSKAQDKAARYPWARKVVGDILKSADDALTTAVILPPKGDTAHYSLANQAQHLGLAYGLSGDERYARKCHEILLKYADAYNGYPLTDLRCRVMALSPLMEATWYQPIVLAYDMVADSGLFSEAERKHIEEDLLRSAVKQFKIDDYASDPRVADLHYRCYNFQAWHIACVGLTGLCLRDPEMIAYAVDGPYGFRHLVSHDVRDDGLFWERSLGYHAFVIEALLPFTEAAYHCGLDLYNLRVADNILKDEDSNYVIDGDNGPKSFKLMFDAPFYFAFPNLSYAVVADSGKGPLSANWAYKIAYHRYRDPLYAWLLNRRIDAPSDRGRVGFLHYYHYRYRYERLRVAENGGAWQVPKWGRMEGGYSLAPDGFKVEDGGASQGDRYLWTKADHRNFAMEWDMIREADSGGSDRAIVVWHVNADDPRTRKAFFLADFCPEIGKTYRFRLEVRGDSGRLLRDGQEVARQPAVYKSDPTDHYNLFYDAPRPGEGEFALAGRGVSPRFASNGVLREGSSLFPSSGFAVLRQPPASGKLPDAHSLAAVFNCGPYGGGHGHPDKLSLVVYADYHHWLPDFGSCGYDSALKGEWTSQTISHNTVVVDEKSQYPSGPHNPTWPTDTAHKRAMGRIDLFHADSALRIVCGRSDSVYPGVRLQRTLIHLGESLVDIFRAKSRAEHLYDYALHIDGSLEKSSLALKTRPGSLGRQSGYQHIADARRGETKRLWLSAWRNDNRLFRLYLMPDGPSEAVVAQSVTTSENARMPMALLRRRAKDVTFAAAMLPGEKGTVQPIENGAGLRIRTAGQESRIYLKPIQGIFRGETAAVLRRGDSVSAAVVSGSYLKVGDTTIRTARPVTLFAHRKGRRWTITLEGNKLEPVMIGVKRYNLKPGESLVASD
ncbi:MAG: heparinase II/III family protein [Armatimonadetes bacterium]|nr:heparinase II/III family protein [Armatimonadota bacterium]